MDFLHLNDVWKASAQNFVMSHITRSQALIRVAPSALVRLAQTFGVSLVFVISMAVFQICR